MANSTAAVNSLRAALRWIVLGFGFFIFLPALSAAAEVSSLAVPVSPSMVWPEMDSRERLARASSYYVFSTGNGGDYTKGGLTVAGGSYLNVRTCNTGTKTAFITKRIFDSDQTGNVPYGGIADPVALTGTQISVASGSTTGSNVIVGGTTSPTLTMTFGVGTTHLNNAAGNAVPTGTGLISPGSKYELTELRILPPGKCFGQYVYSPTGFGATAMLGFRMYAYEE